MRIFPGRFALVEAGLQCVFQVFALEPVPDKTEVTCMAYNEDCPDVEMRGNVALMIKGVATFDDLRFLGRSGRGMGLHRTGHRREA